MKRYKSIILLTATILSMTAYAFANGIYTQGALCHTDFHETLTSEIRPEKGSTFRRDTIYIERVTEIHDTIYIDTCAKAIHKNHKN